MKRKSQLNSNAGEDCYDVSIRKDYFYSLPVQSLEYTVCLDGIEKATCGTY